MVAETRAWRPKGKARLETSALPLISTFLLFPVHAYFLSTPQVEQSYLVLFCTHASQLQDHVQGMVLTILVRGHGVVEARGLSQGCVVLDMTCVMEVWWSVFWTLLGLFAKMLQSCLTLYDPMDCSPPGSSDHGIPQARILEGVAMNPLQGIFPTQRSNSCLLCFLHWQAGSLPATNFSRGWNWGQGHKVRKVQPLVPTKDKVDIGCPT